MKSAEPEHGGKISLKKEITARIFKQKKNHQLGSAPYCIKLGTKRRLLYQIKYISPLTISPFRIKPSSTVDSSKMTANGQGV